MAQSLANKNRLLEKYVEVVRQDGLNTNKNVNIGINGATPNVWIAGNLSVGGTTSITSDVITSTSANAFTVGANGTTNPVLNIDASETSVATGIQIEGQAAGSGANIETLSSGTNESLTIDAKGTGTIGLNTVGTTAGVVTLGNSTSLAGINVNGPVKSNSIILANYEYVTSPTFAAATFANGSAYPIYTFPNDGTTWKLVFASLRFTTAASSAATAQVFLDPSGTAPGAGTAQFATMALNGATNTVVNATAPVSTTSAAGGSISLAAAGAATTGLVGMVLTVALQRLS
jgi:hypothetical protein